MESGTKKYGLIVPKNRLDGVMKMTNVFGDDSDSENEVKNKSIQTNNRTKAQQRSAKLLINKALEEDATVFQYDEVYDDMEKKKERLVEKKKVDDKPRYIQNLLVQAEKRKIEYERVNERLIQKEREAEGDQFRDKEAYVTSSYKKKLEELKKMDEEDLKLSMIESINDVTKQKNMGSFYRHLYKKGLGNDESDEKIEAKTIIQKPETENRQYRKRASSNSSNNDKDTDISDSDSSVDSKKCRKIENQNENKSDQKEVIDESEMKTNNKLLVIEKSRENLDNKQSTDKPELKEIDQNRLKNEKIEENKPKALPKVNIWEKRTVGDIYEAARQRYFERKMKQI